MRVDELSPAPGSTKPKKRVGRGIGGKGGKTAGAGTKGQQSRGRGKVARGFEGGQMPLKQRVPKLKGFNNPFRVEYSPVNLDQIAALGESSITPDLFVSSGLVRKGTFVKVLARGEITTAVNVTAHSASKAAQEAIVAAGGSVTLLGLPYKSGRPPVKGNQFTNR
jgi:large subunit ribosomal protein L15